METTVKLVSTKYHLTNGTKHLFLEVKDGRITLTTNLEREDFKFKHSSPGMVQAIAEMMLKAVEVANATVKDSTV
jgi:hypothetical protein